MEISRIIQSTRDLTPEKLGKTICSLRPLIDVLKRNKLYYPTSTYVYRDLDPLPIYDLFNILITVREKITEETYPDLIIDEIIEEIEKDAYYSDDGDCIEVNGINVSALKACLLYIRIVDYGQADPCAQSLIQITKGYIDHSIEINDSTFVNCNVEITLNPRKVSLHKYIISLALAERTRQEEENCADNSLKTDTNSNEEIGLLKEKLDARDKEIAELNQKLIKIENTHASWMLLVERAVSPFNEVMRPAGFYEIPMIASLSKLAQYEFVMKLLLSKIPLKVALLDHIGFMQFMEEHNGYNKTSILELIAQAVGLKKDNRELKGNIYVLNEESNEDKAKYTAYKSKPEAEAFYKSLLAIPN